MRSSDTQFETAGSLSHGQKNWFALNLGISEEVASGDRMDMYLILINRFDRQSIEARLTPVRVVCSNTLSISALRGLTTELEHRIVTPESIGIVSNLLIRVRKTCRGLYQHMKLMARTPIQVEQLEAMLAMTFPDPSETAGGIAFREVRRARRDAKMLFETGTGNETEGIAGSVWAAINGITEYLDHRREDPATKLESIWFGEGHRAKLRAFQYATLLVKHPGKMQPNSLYRQRQMMNDRFGALSTTNDPTNRQPPDPSILGVRV
jgi:phage/plasmid-like protein (TIGR03299 family)